MEGVPLLEGRYSNILDMYPLECKEFNRVYKFYDHLKVGRWTTTRCKECEKVSYPPRVICPECYSEELEWIVSAGNGWRAVHTAWRSVHGRGIADGVTTGRSTDTNQRPDPALVAGPGLLSFWWIG